MYTAVALTGISAFVVFFLSLAYGLYRSDMPLWLKFAFAAAFVFGGAVLATTPYVTGL